MSASSTGPTSAQRTPMRIGMVSLTVRDLERVVSFYRDVIGLSVIERSAGTARLGAGGVPLLELDHQSAAKADDPRSAGLFHTAFLMPTRPDLARWLAHVAAARIAITGAADHGVSEAIYLDDPEGNGVEVYSDRPRETWRWEGGLVDLPSHALDVEGLLRETAPGAERYSTAPAGLRIGHIHLRVGDLPTAEAFYRDAVGFDLTRRRSGATFLSSGRYHHHIGANVWRSAGAGARDDDRAGLAWFSIVVEPLDALGALGERLNVAGVMPARTDRGLEAEDPWGTRVRFVPA